MDSGVAPPCQLETTTLLYNCGDDLELAVGVLAQTLLVTPGRLQRLGQGVELSDNQVVQKEAHTIAGTFLTIGANSLGNLARQIESDAEAGTLRDMSNTLNLLNSNYLLLVREIEEFLFAAKPLTSDLSRATTAQDGAVTM